MENSEELLNKLGPDRVKVNEQMSLHTYMKVGGPAQYFFEAKNSHELTDAISEAIRLQIPFAVIGQGANTLVSDTGFKGLVVKNNGGEIKYLPHDFLEVDSGVNVLELSREVAKRGLGGLERMTRVPATVGGAIYMNAGDTGKKEFFGDLVVSVNTIDKEGKIKKLHPEELGLSYRTSRFQDSGEIILSAKLQLPKMSQEQIDEKIRDILQRKQRHPAGPSVGSTFRNPEGAYAGELIERAGLKGTVVGKAKISEQHGNFIINTGGAKAADIKELIELMKKTVKDKFDIELVEEVRYLGDWS